MDGERGRNRTFNLLIKSQRIPVSTVIAITFLNQSLTHNQARTEALGSSIEKARIGAYRLEAYGTFYGTPCQMPQSLLDNSVQREQEAACLTHHLAGRPERIHWSFTLYDHRGEITHDLLRSQRLG
jgi:hypothetical protein